MIVKCEQCQTKFKIPDEKVTDKGVKVRCTKCGHTFRVTKDAGSTGGPSAPAAAKTVTLDSADPFSRFGQPAAVPNEEQTRPGVFTLGVEASRMPELGRTGPERNPVAAPPSPGAPRGPAAPVPSAAPFDFSSLVPPAPVAPDVPPSPADGSRPGAPTAPFDFASLVGASPPVAPKAPPGPAPFDFSALTVPPGPPPLPAPLPVPRTSPPARPVDAPPVAFDFSGGLAAPASVAPPQPASLLGDLPPPSGIMSAPSPTAGAPFAPLGDDFFAASTQQVTGALPTVPEGVSKEEARSALFDMAAAAAPAASVPAPAPAPVATPVLPPPEPADFGPSPVPQRLSPPPDPATERSRRVLGIVVNVLIAALLVVGLVVAATATLNEGKLDVDSIGASLKTLVTPASDFTADDVSNGLYDTRMGRPVFYVRGVVTNRSASSARVRVKAELLDGQTLVRAAEVLAGAPPSPEELFLLASPDEVKMLLERAAGRAGPVEPGGSAPFLVPFAEYPPDLKAFRVRVTAVPEGQATAAAP